MTANRSMEGVKVLELGHGIAGSVLGKLRVDQAATVTKVPLGQALEGEPAHIQTAFTVWDLGKRLISVEGPDDLAALLAEADIVIDQDWCAGRERFAELLGYEQFRRRNPRGVYCSITTGLGRRRRPERPGP